MVQPPPEDSQQPSHTSKRRLWLKIAIPAALLITAAAIFVYSQRIAPLVAIRRAIANLGEEAANRIDKTPLGAAAMIPHIVKDGTAILDFSYRDQESKETSGVVSLSSNIGERDFALSADLTRDGEAICAEAYINKERIAFRSRSIDDRFFGFRYSTFHSDIKAFGELVGLEDRTIESLTSLIESVDEALNGSSGFDFSGERDTTGYRDAAIAFVKNLQVSSVGGRIDSGGASISCRKIAITASDEALSRFLNALIDALESDEWLRQLYMSLAGAVLPLLPVETPDDLYEDVLRNIRSFAGNFERGFSGSVTLTFFIGRGDRLLRMEACSGFLYDSAEYEITATLDLGASGADCWALDANVSNRDNCSQYRIAWDYYERPSSVESVVSAVWDCDELVHAITLWTLDSGELSLSYKAGQDSWELPGVLLIGDGGFSLELHDAGLSNAGSLTARIDFANGAEISRIEYVNLDRWGDTLIPKLEALIRDAILRGLNPAAIFPLIIK